MIDDYIEASIGLNKWITTPWENLYGLGNLNESKQR